MHFDVPGCDFGVPGHHFVDPEAPNDTQQDTLGPDLDFSRFLMDFGTPLGPTLDPCWSLFRHLDHPMTAQIP